MLGGQVRVGRDLYDMIIKFTGIDDLDEDMVAGWINDALADFPDIAFIPLREDYVDVMAATYYELPIDFSSVVSWLYDKKPYKYASKIEVTQDDLILFPYNLSNTITLLYNKARQPYDNLDTELPIRKHLRMIIYDYLLFKYYDHDGEGSAEEFSISNKYLNRYEKRKAEAIMKMENRETGDPVGTVDELPKYSRYHHTALQEEDDWDE